MNLLEIHKTFTEQLAHKAVEIEDSAAYAYVKQCFDILRERGEDPADYELVLVQGAEPEITDDGMRVVWSMQLRKNRFGEPINLDKNKQTLTLSRDNSIDNETGKVAD